MPGLLSNQRIFTGEWMDSPDISPQEHIEALMGLRRINRVSEVVDQIAPPIADLCRQINLQRISLMDIACGGGDVPVAVARRCKARHIETDLTFVDRSPTALGHAADAARVANISARTIESDALSISNLAAVDVVTNSLFLHHLKEPEEVILFLRSVRRIARRIVVISDLVRSPSGLLGAWLSCRLLSRSRIVHHDGPASVRAAWTIDELRNFAREAGMHGATIRSAWPWRMLLIWKPPAGE